MISAIKYFLDIGVDIIIIVTFVFSWRTLYYILDAPTRKLYIENYLKVQKVLDKIPSSAVIDIKDVNELAIASQDAELYLNEEIQKLTRNIWNVASEYYSLIEENKTLVEHKNGERVAELITTLSNYKKDLVLYYRKQMVFECSHWIKKFLPKQKRKI